MKRFNLRKKLIETRSSTKIPEIERKTDTNKKRNLTRKWFYRIVSFLIILFFVYIVFKNIIYKDYEGLVKVQIINIVSPFEGYITSFVKDGEVVNPYEPIAKVNSLKLDEDIKTLENQLKILNKQLFVLLSENKRRKNLENINFYIEKAKLLSLNRDDIIRNIKNLKKQERFIKNYIKKLEIQKRKMLELYKVGVVSKPEINAIEHQILVEKEKLTNTQRQISLEKEKLKRINKLKRLAYTKFSKEPLIVDIEYLKRDIALTKSKLNKLKRLKEISYIKYPFKTRIERIYPTGKYVYKDEIIGKALNLENVYIEAYIKQDEIKDIKLGQIAKIKTPYDEVLIGRVVDIGTNVILTPSILVGPLERKQLVIPVIIKIEERKVEGGKVEKIHNNMPVTVQF